MVKKGYNLNRNDKIVKGNYKMYQYKAILRSSQEVVAHGHTIEDVEKQIVHFKRQQKKGVHTNQNNPIDIFHVERNKTSGSHKSKHILVKSI